MRFLVGFQRQPATSEVIRRFTRKILKFPKMLQTFADPVVELPLIIRMKLNHLRVLYFASIALSLGSCKSLSVMPVIAQTFQLCLFQALG